MHCSPPGPRRTGGAGLCPPRSGGGEGFLLGIGSANVVVVRREAMTRRGSWMRMVDDLFVDM